GPSPSPTCPLPRISRPCKCINMHFEQGLLASVGNLLLQTRVKQPIGDSWGCMLCITRAVPTRRPPEARTRRPLPHLPAAASPLRSPLQASCPQTPRRDSPPCGERLRP